MSTFLHHPSEISRLDELYKRRDAGGQAARESVVLAESLSPTDDYEVLWRLSRARFLLGQCATDAGESAGAANLHHRLGARAGERARRLAPLRIEGFFWAGVNLALRAQIDSALRALWLAHAARRRLRRAAKIDHAYHGAGPLRVLARLEGRLPRFLGGSTTRALHLFERAVELAPSNTVTRLYFADLLIESGDTHAAITQLRAILDTPPDETWAYEIRRDKRHAEELLKKLQA